MAVAGVLELESSGKQKKERKDASDSGGFLRQCSMAISDKVHS
jgi:hypothetical protein